MRQYVMISSCISFRFVSLSLYRIFPRNSTRSNGVRVCLPGLNFHYSYLSAQQLIEFITPKHNTPNKQALRMPCENITTSLLT